MTAAAAAERALAAARDSLEDARLLAERGRRTAPVLLELALRQALGAISLSLKLDTPDGLPFDILLGRVPSDHPASALAGRLADPRARDADAVERLIGMLSSPSSSGRTRRGAYRPPPDAKDDAPPPRPAVVAAAPVVADGPTAFEAAAEQRRAAGSDRAAERNGAAGPEASSTAFWSLMDRWPVSDEDALSLLGGGRGLTGRGTRPRFRLRGVDAVRYAMLGRIDTALKMLGETPDWLSRTQDSEPFGGRTPLSLLIDDPDRAGERILHALNRAGLRAASRRG